MLGVALGRPAAVCRPDAGARESVGASGAAQKPAAKITFPDALEILNMTMIKSSDLILDGIVSPKCRRNGRTNSTRSLIRSSRSKSSDLVLQTIK